MQKGGVVDRFGIYHLTMLLSGHRRRFIIISTDLVYAADSEPKGATFYTRAVHVVTNQEN